MVYYLGTDGEAPLFPVWNKETPAFYVAMVDETELERMSGKLPHRNLRYLGSYNGCGCGFRNFRDGIMVTAKAQSLDTDNDHLALRNYLKALPTSGRPAQIFGCWSGDEGEPIEFERTIKPDDIIEQSFGFREREILTLAR
jgi:hypothetical protein